MRWMLIAFFALACSSEQTSNLQNIQNAYQLPLKTDSRYIVDQSNTRVKLKSINWYGASDEFHTNLGLDKKNRNEIAQTILKMGFNSVRLPFSNEMLRIDQAVEESLLTANPDLLGKTPIEVFDALVESLTQAGLLVILNNHTTKSQWCCSREDNDGLWYNDSFSEEEWISDWMALARRYRENPMVIGADLRNELRENKIARVKPEWASGGKNDWRRAAEKAGNAILAIHPDWLIIVEGLEFAANLEGVYDNPIRLDIANRLVYSVHSYHFFSALRSAKQSYQETSRIWGNKWGYILTQNQKFTAPIWVSEFGIGLGENQEASIPKKWWDQLMCYLQNSDIDFAYWAVNGDKLVAGSAKPSYQDESYGLFTRTWEPIENDWRLQDIQRYLMPTRERAENPAAYVACRE